MIESLENCKIENLKVIIGASEVVIVGYGTQRKKDLSIATTGS